jgi:hypothetical protein
MSFHRSLRGSLLGSAALVWLLGAAAAHAVSFPLDVEFDDALTGNFGNVEVTEETGGDLLFVITLNTATLGDDADLHELYFNLPSAVTGASISTTDVVNTDYELDDDVSVQGGAGAEFTYEVNFGNGAGPSGNGVLQTASFLLAADSDLTIDDLLIPSSTAGSGVTVFVAAHVQGTELTKENSETVGSSVPEPGSLGLAAIGLVWLAWRQRRAATTQLRPDLFAS